MILVSLYYKIRLSSACSAHIPRCIHIQCIYLHTAAVLCQQYYVRALTAFTYTRLQKAHGGAIDRRGQQNTVFSTFVGLPY
jgi:hypothetical protein